MGGSRHLPGSPAIFNRIRNGKNIVWESLGNCSTWLTVRSLKGGYVYSWEDEMKLTDPDKPWTLDVSQKNFQTNAALIQCQGKNGYNGDVISERLWIVTRLHSPLGYPTDPIICGGKLGKCEDLTWLFRVECMPDYGPEYRGSVSKTKSGILIFFLKEI